MGYGRDRGQVGRSVRKEKRMLNVSVLSIAATAVAEKVSALMTEDYLEQRAKRGKRKDYEAVLAKVPDVEPEERDRL